VVIIREPKTFNDAWLGRALAQQNKPGPEQILFFYFLKMCNTTTFLLCLGVYYPEMQLKPVAIVDSFGE
jgi:hypothetical protein